MIGWMDAWPAASEGTHMTRAQALLAFGLLTLGGFTGCVVDATPPQGDLTLSWTFAGQDCAHAGIATVNVRLFDRAGTAFVNDTFPCSAGHATYGGLAAGNVGFDLEGFSGGGTRLYQGTGTVPIHAGSNAFAVDLTLPQ
jgi:hypothetical protein